MTEMSSKSVAYMCCIIYFYSTCSNDVRSWFADNGGAEIDECVICRSIWRPSSKTLASLLNPLWENYWIKLWKSNLFHTVSKREIENCLSSPAWCQLAPLYSEQSFANRTIVHTVYSKDVAYLYHRRLSHDRWRTMPLLWSSLYPVSE